MTRPPVEAVLTVREAARIARESEATIRNRLYSGELEGRLKKPMRVSVVSLAEYLRTTPEAVNQALAAQRGLRVCNVSPSRQPSNDQAFSAPERSATRRAANVRTRSFGSRLLEADPTADLLGSVLPDTRHETSNQERRVFEATYERAKIEGRRARTCE